MATISTLSWVPAACPGRCWSVWAARTGCAAITRGATATGRWSRYQAELRQHIYNRHGVAVWVGAGNVFPTFGEFNPAHTLPNYGVGYRWEFKNKVNVRFDYGFGKGENSFLFSINEAF